MLAFNALLVLMVLGCGFLCINLRDSIRRMQSSDIGEDNEILTGGGTDGNAAWLKGIQATQGRYAGKHTAGIRPVVEPKPKAKKPKAKKGRQLADVDAAEMAALRPSKSSSQR